MKPKIILSDFKSILPKIEIKQKDTFEFIHKLHSLKNKNEKLSVLINRYGVKESQISKRLFEDTDLVNQNADINERMLFFDHRAREIFLKFYAQTFEPPDHIIHVTCTGYVAPSAAQFLVNQKKWALNTKVTHAYHMGCFAAISAIRMAEGFVMARDKHVDIVHTEMCGLHMDVHDHSPEQMVVQSLFADGHIRYTASDGAQAKTGFRILNFCEQIIPDSQTDMSWMPASWGMKMTLSRNVPSKIADCLRAFMVRLTLNSETNLADVLKNATFAVHPGGPKIIDTVRAILELQENQISESREVLLQRGNMSSATLPHIWKNLLDQNLASKKIVVSLAFGPGLTIFGALFETI